ncbi:hypothetical protein BMF94_6771 [Rhodotorula taiwanensis]|uniref:Uncharacterized protein n=1 Tax=Rhodotorula taiwanensis TaxID=741276 RepID=A0A2S5B080_9BASI|nr:hypothetical protein BMF94_6771 [Rhodotorula taiwanensis]
MATLQDRPALQPIIKRSHSPSQQAISNEALRSPTFVDEPPSPNSTVSPHAAAGVGGHSPHANKPHAAGSYFALQPTATSHAATAGILLNRLDRDGHISPGTEATPIQATQGSTLRVASPDGSASESGMSDQGVSTAPTSAAGSPPPAHSFGLAAGPKPTLSTLYMGPSHESTPGSTRATSTPADPSQPSSIRRVSSPPSPHCHFAPLPRLDSERPVSRRNSTANRVKPFVPKAPKAPEKADSILATPSASSGAFPWSSDAARSDESGLPSPPGNWPAGDSSIPSAQALSQRLSSSLTFADPASLSPNVSSTGATGSATPGSRPTSRRSSSSRRSRSPSPHYFNQSRERLRNASAGSAAATSGSEGRTHSPILSRHASTDALSLHYIEQQRDLEYHRVGTGRSEPSSGRILSRTSSRAGSERDAGGDGGTISADRSRRSSTSRVRASSSTSAIPNFVDRDKEADLHRLETKALAGNADAERCVSPALRAHEEQQRMLGVQRERSTSRGASAGGFAEIAEPKSHVVKRTSSHEEIVQVKPPAETETDRGDGELEEVLEEPEDAEDAVAEEETGEGVSRLDDEDDDDEGDDDEEDEDDDDDNDDDEGPEQSRDDDDEDDEEPEEEDRKTSLGAAVEVVRWHRAERDQESVPSTPALGHQQNLNAPLPALGAPVTTSNPPQVAPAQVTSS